MHTLNVQIVIRCLLYSILLFLVYGILFSSLIENSAQLYQRSNHPAAIRCCRQLQTLLLFLIESLNTTTLFS